MTNIIMFAFAKESNSLLLQCGDRLKRQIVTSEVDPRP